MGIGKTARSAEYRMANNSKIANFLNQILVL